MTVAILDTGIRWEHEELIEKVRLNTAELPAPQGASSHDASGDGRVSVSDWAADPRVAKEGGDDEADKVLDASDLIAAFSDRTDSDGNGYTDDIAGWDFFDDDNDPFDVSSCCSASNHGTGRAREAAAATNNAAGEAGMCPACTIMPLRVWDSFVVPTDQFALATAYAADNGAAVVEGAVGGLTNTQFARQVFTYADARGVTLTMVSSDINSANHNYPTNYNEAIYVAGALPDTAPGENCETPGLPGVGGDQQVPGCKEFLAAVEEGSGGGLQPSSQPPTTSMFRNSNLTQYGGKADVVLMGSTGSENTGQASGAAALLQAFARRRFAGQSQYPKTLSGNEIRQLLTMSAEDVLPGNTGRIGNADKAKPGWDMHFGYGRVNLAKAMAMIQAGRIPPEAQLDAPDWFAPVNVDRLPTSGLEVRGRAQAPHSGGVGAWELEWACGHDALDSDFKAVPGASGRGPVRGALGTVPKSLVADIAANCDGSVSDDAGLPAGDTSSAWPRDPYPSPDPMRHSFTLRLTVHDRDDPANVGRYRKVLHAYENDGNLDGWPKPVGSGSDARRLVTGSGGEAGTRLYDLDADGDLDVLLPTSSGELWALDPGGRPLRSWNSGRPVQTEPLALAAAHRGALRDVPGGLPRESLRYPAIGDVTGDGEAEVLATAGEHLYGWTLRGERLRGFPLRVDPAFSEPCKPGVPKPCFAADQRLIDRKNHVKRGFVASPALADLTGDGVLDVVAGSLDQHLYAWTGRGKPVPGFPVELTSGEDADAGTEIVTSPAVADLDGDERPEIVVMTNEVVGGAPEPQSPFDFFDFFVGQATGFVPVYAIKADGKPVPGWPVRLASLLPDVLPFVVPGHDAAVLDVDRDGNDEVVLSATAADARMVDGDGSTIRTFSNGGQPGDNFDPARQLNLAEYPAVGDLQGSGNPAVLKGGLSLNGVLNLAAPNQNFPFNHTVQAWDPRSGQFLPGYPRATDDFQLFTQPAVGRVTASGTARQAIVGTGLYQLHAYGPSGAEAPGWPKFTGGWTATTSSLGDVDGDGLLDVSGVTREGWSFLWRTEADVCTGNNEWWTFHHDERGSSNYGVDGRPPSAPGAAVRRGDAVEFAAAGDDWSCGAPARYEVRGSRIPITSAAAFARARKLDVKGKPELVAGGRTQALEVPGASGQRFLAIRAVDEAGNTSALGGARGRCLSRRARLGSRGIGRLRIGVRRARALRVATPIERRGRRWRFCVDGGGRVTVVFSPRGDARLVASTGRLHRSRGVGRGSRVRAIRRAYRGARRLRPNLWSARTGSTRLLFGTRRGRVNFVAVADRRLLKSRRELRRYLRP